MNEDLKDRIEARFSGDGPGLPPAALGDLCRQLVEKQRTSWAEFGDACSSLRDTLTRDIECPGFSVRLLYNPGRSTNTLASVTPQDITKRPCFLCGKNLPSQQKAILYRNEFLILGNPRPIVPFHLTIAHRAHLPQSIYACMEKFLHITQDMGPGFTTLYNGPRCGASAPDHLHFQAVPSGEMPIEKELEAKVKFFTLNTADHVTLSSGRGLGREIILVEGKEPANICTVFKDLIDSLRTGPEENEEPMINVIGHYGNEEFRIAVFPRRAHRPAAFFRNDTERIMVSPAVMEMGGVIVTPSEIDFDRLDAETVESIYREVSLMP
jgi:hypothetical protein